MKHKVPTEAELKAALMSHGPTGKNECCHFCGHDFQPFEFYEVGWRKKALLRACKQCSPKLRYAVCLCQHRPAAYRMPAQVGRA